MIARRIGVFCSLFMLLVPFYVVAQNTPAKTLTEEAMTSTSVPVTTTITSTTVPAAVTAQKDRVIVGILDDESKAVFEEKVLPFIKDQAEPCGRCEFVNFSQYDKEGAFIESKLIDSLKNAGAKASFLFISWNRPMASDQQKIVETLKKLVKDGVLIIATAGTAHMDQSTLPLGKTVLGQVPEIVIIGEMRERERLLQQSFYGPEMLTAIRPPKGIEEAGYSPALFAAKLAQNFHRKTGQEWLVHFRETKAKSRKMWPDVTDFFRR